MSFDIEACNKQFYLSFFVNSKTRWTLKDCIMVWLQHSFAGVLKSAPDFKTTPLIIKYKAIKVK